MIVGIYLKRTARVLEQAGIGTARLDALVLLEDVIGKDRGWLLAHPEFELSTAQIKKLNEQIERRSEHEPIAYIRNKTEFYGREFYIDHRVLEPRPESETMIEMLKSLEPPAGAIIIDVGTGSGMLAITAKLELSETELIATDIDEKCLAVARKNAKRFDVPIKFAQGDLLKPVAALEPFALLCNLPYVPTSFQISPAAMAEPQIAIFGGKDGLDVYRKFFGQLKSLGSKPKFILTEALPPQHQQLAEIAKLAGYYLVRADDFIQVFAPK